MPARAELWNVSAERVWYGEYDPVRIEKIRGILARARKALMSEFPNVACWTPLALSGGCRKRGIEQTVCRLCRKNTAFANLRNKHYPDIHLCPRFFQGSSRAHDLWRLEVMIHEAVHWGGALKWVERYPAAAVQRIARLRPERAIRNAANHAKYVIAVCNSA